jgi:PTS system nitrogen regulatory IIA component
MKSPSLSDVLARDRVCVVDTDSKTELLETLIGLLARSPRVTDEPALRQAIFAREELMSTGIGLGVGIPHVRLDSVTDVAMAMAVSRREIADYESLDEKPVRIVFMIAANSSQHAEYIRLLGMLSQQLKSPAFREKLLACQTADELYSQLAESLAPSGSGNS